LSQLLYASTIRRIVGRHQTNLYKNYVGGLPREVYKCLQARIHEGSTVCLLKYADAYRPLSHMLDPYGMIWHGKQAEYTAKLRIGKRRIDEFETGSVKYTIYKRLTDHLKKNRTRRGVDVFALDDKSGDTNERCLRRFGFTVDEFIADFESKFTEGMTWDRFMAGDVQIDHVMPIRVFDLTKESGVRAAYALSNSQPLWRGDNARKGRTTDKEWIALFGEGLLSG
jgi:hypothetical protein